MDLSQILTQFFSLPTVVFTLGIGAIVWVIRRVLQTSIPALRARIWWTEVFLPVAPPIIGVVIAYFATGYPYPEIFSKSTSAHLFFGLVCGFFSSKLYRIGWVILKKRLMDKGVDITQFESMRPEGSAPLVVVNVVPSPAPTPPTSPAPPAPPVPPVPPAR